MSPLSKLIELSSKDVDALVTVERTAHISPWSQGMFEGSFNKRSENFGLMIDEQLVGYFIAEFVAGEMTLHNVCVDKLHQGKGYATQLMQHFLSRARTLSAEEVWLEVRVSNTVAITLYEKFGFETRGVRKNYYSLPTPDGDGNTKEDALLMCLPLNAS